MLTANTLHTSVRVNNTIRVVMQSSIRHNTARHIFCKPRVARAIGHSDLSRQRCGRSGVVRRRRRRPTPHYPDKRVAALSSLSPLSNPIRISYIITGGVGSHPTSDSYGRNEPGTCYVCNSSVVPDSVLLGTWNAANIHRVSWK